MAEQLLEVLHWHTYSSAPEQCHIAVCSVYEGSQNACRILAIKLEGNRPICRWENNIKMDVKVTD
jgi:hypothetical protein